MLHFDSNRFLKSNKKERGKGISEPMLCFNNNAFSKSNEKVQHLTQIGVQKPIPRFTNNVVVLGNDSIGPLSINVGPSRPFHLWHFLFCHSFRVAPKVQKVNISTRNLVFGKMKRVNKEEAKRLS
jgi:hypothetical protein